MAPGELPGFAYTTGSGPIRARSASSRLPAGQRKGTCSPGGPPPASAGSARPFHLVRRFLATCCVCCSRFSRRSRYTNLLVAVLSGIRRRFDGRSRFNSCDHVPELQRALRGIGRNCGTPGSLRRLRNALHGSCNLHTSAASGHAGGAAQAGKKEVARRWPGMSGVRHTNVRRSSPCGQEDQVPRLRCSDYYSGTAAGKAN